MQGISGSGVVGSGVGAGVGTGVGAAEDGKVKEDRMFETELLSTLEGTISLGDARICPFIPLTVKPAFVVASMVVYFRFSLSRNLHSEHSMPEDRRQTPFADPDKRNCMQKH